MSVESRDYPDVHDVEDKSRGRRQKEFDDLLDLAEKLQENCDRGGQRLLFNRMVEAAALLGVVVGSGIIATGTHSSDPIAIALLVAYVACVGLFVTNNEYLKVRKILVRTKRDHRALSEVVELLRSTERSMAKDEGLSVLERARLRIQLSRFDI